MDLFWSAGRMVDDQMESTAGRAPRSGARQGELQIMRDELDKLELICQSMWELLRDRFGVTDEELMAKMAELDLRDGVADGKVKRGPRACPSCGRMVSQRHRYCIYCGATVSTQPFR